MNNFTKLWESELNRAFILSLFSVFCIEIKLFHCSGPFEDKCALA